MNYSEFVTAISGLSAEMANDTAFLAILPRAIDYAEQRIYRELDLITTMTRDSSRFLTPNQRTFSIPSGAFVVVEEVNIITPVGAASADVGVRNPARMVARSYLDFVYPSADTAGQPRFFTVLSDTTLLFGPWPDLAYRVELVGTARPATLSDSNTTTFLSLYLPDLFMAAAMIFVTGWQKNFGAQADDPRTAQSWETQYQALKASAAVEELRKKFMSRDGSAEG